MWTESNNAFRSPPSLLCTGPNLKNSNSSIYQFSNLDNCNSKSSLAQKLNTELTWDGVLKESHHSDLAPLLYHILTSINDINQINPIIQELKKGYYHSLVKNMLLYDELGQVLKSLKGMDIDVILLKGIALAETVYRNIALRPMGDMDLLIKDEELPRVKELLSNRLYQELKIQRHSLDSANSKFTYIKKIGNHSFSLDLHLNLEGKSTALGINMDEIWRNAIESNINGEHVLLLSMEDTLLYACWHTSHHLFPRLIWLCDIARIISVYDESINWGTVIKRAEEWKIKSQIYYSLYLAEELVGASIPLDVLIKLKPGHLQARLFNFIMYNMGYWNGHIKEPNHLFLFSLQLLLKDGVINKIKFFARYFKEHIFPARKYIMERFSISDLKLIYFYWPIHFIILIFQSVIWFIQIVSYFANNRFYRFKGRSS